MQVQRAGRFLGTISLLLLSLIAATPARAAVPISEIPDANTWGCDSIINTMVRVGDVIYVGGDFTNIVSRDGFTRLPAFGLAAFDANTGQPTLWRPMTDNGNVFVLSVSPDGTEIYAGGAFARVDGQVRPHFAAISTNGTVKPWTANVGGIVRGLAVSPNGTIYMGGTINAVNGTNRNCVAAIQPPASGTGPATLLPFAPNIAGGSGGANPYVNCLALANGDIVAAGEFTTVNGASETNQARFDPVTGASKGWTANTDLPSKAICIDGVNYYIAFGGKPATGGNCAKSFGPTGNERWKSSSNGDCQAIAFWANRVFIGGHWTKFDGSWHELLCAASPSNGAPDTSWEPSPDLGLDRGVWALVAAGDKLHVGGAFQRVNTTHPTPITVRGYAQFSVHDNTAPSVPQNVTLLSTNASRVRVRWNASTDNLQLAGYDVFRDGATIAGVGTVTEYFDNTTVPVTTYAYRVRAKDGVGNLSALSTAVNVTTPPDGLAPTTPTNFSAVVINPGQVDMAWDPATDNIAVMGYDILRNNAVIASIGNVTNHSDTTAVPLTTYTYKVRARDGDGNVSPASTGVIVTMPTETESPTAPSNLTAADVGPVQVNLAWTPSTDNYVVQSYDVYRNGILRFTISGALTNYSDTTALPSTTYTYFLIARDGAGNSSDPSNVAAAATPADNTSPTAPGNFTAVPNGPIQMKLNWTPSTDNVGVTAYDLERNGSPLAILGGGATNYTDNTVAPATGYTYQLVARDLAGNVSPPAATPLANTPADTSNPSVPGGFAAKDYGSRRADLSWTASTDNVGVTGYDVYRNNSFLLTIGFLTNYSDTVTPKSTNSYKIRARDLAGNLSGFTATKKVITPGADTQKPTSPTNFTATVLGSTQVRLGWKKSTDNRAVVAYDIYRNSTNIVLVSVTVTNHTDATVLPLSTNSYFVQARDADGNLSNPSVTRTVDTPADTAAPSAPSNLVATAASDHQVNLNWLPAIDNVGVTQYDIFRGTNLLATTGPVTNYSDTTVVPLTEYAYQLRAHDAVGNISPLGNVANVTTLADMTPPTIPTNLTGTAVSPAQVDLGWDPSTDYTGVAGYQVFRNGNFLANVGAVTNFSDITVDPGASYEYKLRARDPNDNASAFSDPTTVETLPDTEPPMPGPTNLTASAISESAVYIEWTAAQDNGRIAFYELFRDGELLGNVGLVTNYTDNGLTPVTTYLYMVRAHDSGSNVSDPSNPVEVMTLADLTPPTAPTNLVATANGTQVDLRWKASTDNVGVTGYDVFRNGTNLIALGVVTNHSDTTVADATLYDYVVRARDGVNNESDFSNIATVTTPDTVPPSAPSALNAWPVSATQIGLSWNAATDNLGVAGYDIWRDGALVGTSTGTYYTANGMAPLTAHNFQVRARDAANNLSDLSNMASAGTLHDSTAPSTPSNLTATVASPTQIDLNWSAASDDVGVIGYDVYRGGVLITNIGAVTSFSDTGLTPDTNYSYQLRARDGVGLISGLSNMATAKTAKDLDPPSMPTGVGALPYGSRKVNIFWLPSTDNVGVTGYRIIRNTLTLTDVGPVTTYQDTVNPRSTNTYKLRAFDASGNLSPATGGFTAITPAADTTKPSTPANLGGTAVSPVQVDLQWPASTDNVGVVGYDITRNGVFYLTTPTSANSYSDTNCTPSTAYAYIVRARDADGNLSNPSPTKNVTTPADTTSPTAASNLVATAISLTRIDLAWNPATDVVGVTAYEIYRNGSLLTTIGPITAFSDTGLAASTLYSYQVKARDGADLLGPASNTANATTFADTQIPMPPTDLAATAMSETQVDLGWNGSTDNVGVTGYNIYRDGALFTQIGSGTNFSDTLVAPFTAYDYQVRARDGSGNLSNPSNLASVQTPDNQPPTAPTNLVATVINAAHVDLVWEASTDTVAVVAYDIYRGTNLVASVGAVTNHSDITAIPDNTYTYVVRARDASGNESDPSNSAEAITPPDTEAPTAPTNLDAVATGSARIDLGWDASTDNVGVLFYDIYRDGPLLTSISGSLTNHADTTVGPGETHTYELRARDAAGLLSGPSNFDQATTPADTIDPTAPNLTAVGNANAYVELAWSGATDDVAITAYNVYRGTNLITSLGVVSNYTDSTTASATAYAYQVRARDAAGNESDPSNTANVMTPDIIPPSAPSNLTATAIDHARVDLGWDASTDNVGIAGYNIFRDTAFLTGVGSVTNYSDTSVVPGTTYSYQVRARDAANNLSGLSNTDDATTPTDTEAPSIPANLQATVQGPARVNLTWDASTDNIGLAGYDLFRNNNLITNVGTITVFLDATVVPATTNNYQVRARDLVSNLSDLSAAANAITPPDTTTPTPPTNVVASAFNSHRIDIRWEHGTDDVGVTQYRVARNNSTIATISSAFTNYTDNTVSASTTYNYKVRSLDAAAHLSVASQTASATTPAPDPAPPSTPANLTATAVSATQIDLNWQAATDNVAVIGYDVFRGTNLLVTVGAVTNYSDTTVLPLAGYNYQVRARDAEGNVSGLSNIGGATTPTDTTSPSVPANLEATAVSETQVNLTWNAVTDNVGVTGYEVHRDNNLIATVGSVTNYSDTTVSPLTTYEYQVKAKDAAGNLSGLSNTEIVMTSNDDENPTTPTGLDAVAAGPTQVDLTWNASTDNVAVTGYNVYRGVTLITQIVAVASFSDTTVSPFTSYDYSVRARDAAGNLSDPSNTDNVVTPDGQPPTAPTNLTNTLVSVTQVDLAWDASTDDAAVTAYDIYRDTVLVGSVGAVTNYSDTSVAPNTSYDYQVRARDAANNESDPSNTHGVTTPADTDAPTVPANLTATTVAAGQIDLGWDASTDNVAVTAYDIYRDGGLLTALGVVTNYSDSTVSPATLYTYELMARDAAGNTSGPSNSAQATTLADTEAPTAPTLTAVTNGSAHVELAWTASTDNVGVTGYNLHRDGSLLIALGTVLDYADTTTVSAISYAYQVFARDATNNVSVASNTANVTTPDIIAPSVPVNLAAAAISQSRIDLGWDASSDNVAVTAYNIYRGVNLLTTVGAVTNFSDTTANPDTTYAYIVRAKDAAGNESGDSNEAQAATPADSVAPTTPTNLTAVANSSAHVELAWGASTDNVGVTGYNVYRGGDLVTNLAAVTSYMDTTTASATNYSYEVRARDTANNLSDPSNGANVNTPDIIPPSAPAGLGATPISHARVDLDWGASTDNVAVTGYNVYRDGSQVGSVGAVTNYSDLTTAPTTNYNYTVKAKDAANNLSDASNTAPATTPADSQAPSTPGSLTATATGAAKISLGWNASTDNIGVTGYDIIRGTNVITTVAAVTNYLDTTVSPSTAYSYKVRARDGTGNVSGDSNTANATTPADTTAPATPTGLVATAFNSHRIDLRWQPATDDVGVTQYRISRNNALLLYIGAVTNYSDTTGLVASSNYFYKVKAVDAAGNESLASNSANVTTPPPDPTPPSAPTNLTANAISATQVNLGWQASTDNVAVIGYDVYRGVTLLASLGVVTNYSDTTTAATNAYSYQVKAKDAEGNVSAASNTANVNTPADTTAPSAPTSLGAVAVSATQVDLNWNAATDNVGVTAYDVYRNSVWIASVGVITNHSDTTVSPTNSYNYQVKARDAAGNPSVASNTAAVNTPADTTAPGAPSGLDATAASATQVNLHWTAPTDNVGVTGYDVYRDDSLIASIGSVTNYSDSPLAPLTGYNYKVKARDAADNMSDFSNTAGATTLADTTAPTGPTNLLAVATSVTNVDLSWVGSIDNVDVTHYDLYRDDVFLSSVTGVETNYSDATVSASTAYSYQVFARDGATNVSSGSNVEVVTTDGDTESPIAPANLDATAVSGTQVDLDWDAATDNTAVTGYLVYRDGSLVAILGAVTNYSDTNAVPATTYSYEVVARDAAGNLSDPSNADGATTPQ